MIRKVATGLIAFKLKNVKEIQSIFDEYVVGLTKDQFIDILKYVDVHTVGYFWKHVGLLARSIYRISCWCCLPKNPLLWLPTTWYDCKITTWYGYGSQAVEHAS
jgi:hypothetical protein